MGRSKGLIHKSIRRANTMNRSRLMINVIFMLVPLLTPVIGKASTSMLSIPEALPKGAIVNGNSQFAFKMQRQFGDYEHNAFFSPYSISLVFGMLYSGAADETAQQIKNTFHFPADQHALPIYFGRLNNQLMKTAKDKTTGKNIELNIANGIWVEKSYHFLPSYIEILKNSYQSKINKADFLNNLNQEIVQINSWVEQKTNDRIKDLIPDGALNPLTKMVLVNAIYFKGDWQKPFKGHSTTKGDFYTFNNQILQTQMMHQRGRFSVAEDENTQLIELLYQGGNYSMLVLLPKNNSDIKQFETNLTSEKLNQLTNKLAMNQVSLSLPKFKFVTEYRLNSYLSALGVTNAFSSKADFSNIDGTQSLQISEVIHKAFIEVNEKGAEAAAATAVVIRATSIPNYVEFNANRPFVFMIKEKTTDSILFIGRFAAPNKKKI